MPDVPQPRTPEAFRHARDNLIRYATAYMEQLNSGSDLSFGLAKRVNEAAIQLGFPEPFKTSEGTGENARSIYVGYNDFVGEKAGWFRIVDHLGVPVPLSDKHRAAIVGMLRSIVTEAQALAPEQLPSARSDDNTPVSELRKLAAAVRELHATSPAEQGKAATLAAPTPSHSADFTFVNWYGTEYTFALGVQSSAVHALWDEWAKSGLGLHQDTIRNAIDAERDSFRMDTAFRNHPAFGTMIQRCGDGKYKLAPPSAEPPAPKPKAKKSAGITSKSRRKRV